MIDINDLAEELLQSTLRITGVYKVALPPNQTYGDVKIKNAGFLYVMQGESDFICDGNSYSLKTGSVLHGMKHMHLKYTTGRGGEFKYSLINYELSSPPARPCQYLNRHFVLDNGVNPDIAEKLSTLYLQSLNPGSLSALRLHVLFGELLHDTLLCSRLRSAYDRHSVMVEETIAYLNEHYMHPLALSDLAARYDVSNGFFAAKFRQHMGISPIDYLLQIRINRAKELLATNQCTVREAARRVGYADAYYFSRLFKKYTGIAPSHVLVHGLHLPQNRN